MSLIYSTLYIGQTVVNPKMSKNKKKKKTLTTLTSKMSSRCPRKALYRPKKWHFQKPQKAFVFFRFLGARGLPREPQETQEGSQKAPKELQNLAVAVAF